MLPLLPQCCLQVPAATSSSSTEACPADAFDNLYEAVFLSHGDASNRVLPLQVLRSNELPVQVGEAASQQISKMLQQPPLQQLLQRLTACVWMLHQEHTTQQQQQQHSTAEQASSSSRGGATDGTMKWPPRVRAHLLPIPPLHQAMLTSLPGGQAYLDEAAAVAAERLPGAQRQRFCWLQARMNLTALSSGVEDSLQPTCRPQQRTAHQSAAPAAVSQLPAANAALLAVVFARILVQLADAMDAAGPQLLFKSLMAKPMYALMWMAGVPGDARHLLAAPHGPPPQHTAEVQWHFWQLFVLSSARALVSTLFNLGLLRTASGAAAEATATGAVADTHSTHGASNSSSSSSSSEQPKWGFLLHLQDINPR
jgi:hypothetical protein